MRLPFDSSGCKFEEDARVKFLFSSPELHQNIEISLDGDSTSVEALLDAFQRFLGALGINIPENTVLGFIELDEDEEDGEEDEISDEEIIKDLKKQLNKPEQKDINSKKNNNDEDEPPSSNKNNKKK